MSNSDPMFDPILAALPRDLRPAEMLYPTPGAFLENLAFDPSGALHVTSLYGREILRWEEGKGGSVFSKLDIHPMSLERDLDGYWYIAGHGVNVHHDFEAMQRSQQVWRMDSEGRAEHFVDLPDARLLNGMMRLSPGVFLFADSYAATIWRLDVKTREVSPWIRHDSLSRVQLDSISPAANGIKAWRDQVVVSNSATQSFVYVRVGPDGRAGDVNVRKTKVTTDDFVVLDDGTILLTTHGLCVVRLRPNEELHVICEDDAVRGNTAVLAGVRMQDRRYLYVVGDGGMWHNATKLAGIARIDMGEDLR